MDPDAHYRVLRLLVRWLGVQPNLRGMLYGRPEDRIHYVDAARAAYVLRRMVEDYDTRPGDE